MSPFLLFSQPITNLVWIRCRSAPFQYCSLLDWFLCSPWFPPWSLVSHVYFNGFCLHGPTDDRTITFSRLANRSKFPGCLFEGGRLWSFFLLVIKSIIVPFYSLHVELSIKRQQERARTIISTPHRPLSKMLLPAKKTKPINDSLILHFFSFYFITEIS